MVSDWLFKFKHFSCWKFFQIQTFKSIFKFKWIQIQSGRIWKTGGNKSFQKVFKNWVIGPGRRKCPGPMSLHAAKGETAAFMAAHRSRAIIPPGNDATDKPKPEASTAGRHGRTLGTLQDASPCPWRDARGTRHPRQKVATWNQRGVKERKSKTSGIHGTIHARTKRPPWKAQGGSP